MKRERVIAAVAHMETEYAPYNIELCGSLAKEVCAAVGIAQSELWDYLGNHIEKASYNRGALEGGVYTDEFGVRWDRRGLDKEIGIIAEPLLKQPDLADYRFPEPDLMHVRKTTQEMTDRRRDSFKLGKIGTTLFERAWSLRGFEVFLTDMLLEEDFARELLEKIVEFNLPIIHAALASDIDGFYFGDDYGQQSGPLMSPACWRALIKPCLAKLFAPVKAAGKVVALHSCGDVSLLLDDLIDIGLDIYQTFQPEIYDLEAVKQRYGARLTFWGGISTQRTLPFVTPDELRIAVKRTLNIMAPGGGYIAAPTHQVPFDVPVQNILAMAETLKNPWREGR